jgi:hypothetical protein
MPKFQMPGAPVGNTGIGSNFARARLLLAKRSGYLPEGMGLATTPQGATEQWRSVSKNLAANARSAGFKSPMMFLRAGAQSGGKLPTRAIPGTPQSAPLAYANSQQAMMRIDPRALLQYLAGRM